METNDIIITAKMIDLATVPIIAMLKNISKIIKENKNISKGTLKLKTQQFEWKKITDKLNFGLKRQNLKLREQSFRLSKQRFLYNKLNQTLRKNQVSMMTTMYTFKALGNAMRGLLNPSLKTVGVFDVISTLLTVLFLPAALWVLDVFLWLFYIFTSLPKPVQDVIDIVVVLTAVISSIIVTITLFNFFLTTNATAILGVGKAIGGAIKAIMSMNPIILIIIAAIVLLWAMWKTNFGNIRQHAEEIWNGIKKIFKGGIEFIKGLMTTLYGILTLNPDIINEGFQKIIDGVKGIMSGALEIGKAFIGFIVDGISQAGHLIWDTLTNLPIVGGLIKAAGGLVGKGFEVVKKVVGKVIGGTEQDFIQRPGMPATSFSPNDTIIGMKNPGSMGSNVTINSPITINATVNSGIDMNKLSQQIEGNIRQNLLKYSQVK